MRLLLSVIALLTLTGCVSDEQRMIALAKAHCTEQIAKEYSLHGTFSWSATQSPDGKFWTVEGALEPQRRVGVSVMILPDRSEVGCGIFETNPISSGNRALPVPPQP